MKVTAIIILVLFKQVIQSARIVLTKSTNKRVPQNRSSTSNNLQTSKVSKKSLKEKYLQKYFQKN